jgi:hypothetical protein
MDRREFTKVMTAVVAGMVAGSRASAEDKPAGDKHTGAGKGKNECKGKGGCATAEHDCAGKNACKGKGGCDAVASKHGCKGKNECKGKGGCKTKDHECAGKNACKGKGGCAAAPPK